MKLENIDIKNFFLGEFYDPKKEENLSFYATKINEKFYIDYFYSNDFDYYVERVLNRIEKNIGKEIDYNELYEFLNNNLQEVKVPFEEKKFLKLFFNEKKDVKKALRKYLEKYLEGEKIPEQVKKVIDKEIKKMEEEEKIEREKIEKIRKVFGDEIVLNKIENQYGEKIVEKGINVNESFFYQINCYSSSDLGLGGCRCVNHNPYWTQEIKAEDILKIIENNLENILKQEENEINFNIKLDKKNDFDKKILKILDKAKKILEKEKEENIRIKSILSKLKEIGLKENINLKTIKNQYDEKIPEKYIYIDFENGKIYYGEINCFSSSDLGLGTCRCVSHPPIKEKEINLKKLFEIMKKEKINKFFNLKDIKNNKIKEIEELLTEEEKKEFKFIKKNLLNKLENDINLNL